MLSNVHRNRPIRLFLAIVTLLILRPHPLPDLLAESLKKGKESYQMGNPLEGIRSLEDAVAYAPYLVALNQIAAEGALSIGDAAAALRFAGAASEAFPDSQRIWCLAVQSRIALGGRDIAQGLDLKQAASCPQGADVLADAAESLFEMGETYRAREILDYLLRPAPLLPRKAAFMAALYVPGKANAALRELALRDQDQRTLAQDLLTALEDTGDEAESVRSARVGHVFSMHGEWRLAALGFREAIRLQPENAQAHAYLGLALDQLGSDGVEELAKASQLDPADPTSAVLLGLHWLHAGDAGKAEQELDRALHLDPSSPSLLAEMGRVQALLGNFPGAKASLLEATGIAPRDPRYWRMLAEFSTDYEVEVGELGIPAARNALVLSESCAKCLDLIGYGYFLIGNVPLAERFLWKASAEDPLNAKSLYHLGILLAFQGKNGLARQALGDALSLDADGAVTPLAVRTLERLGP